MGEPYRSLLGHFRHEIGHYYWDALVAQVAGSSLTAPFPAMSALTTPRRSRRTIR